MGLYIKDMKMPKAGQVIEISEGITGTVYARISPGFDKWHPVIPVPPHGRCIDADALKTKGPDTRDTWVDYDGREDTVMGFSLDMLDHAPTIIPKEKEA